MSFLAYYENEQSAARASAMTGQYYLLDRNFSLISAKTGAENAEIGTSFFNLYPSNRVLREEIVTYVHSYPADVLLTLCARTPILFAGTLLAQTGLILAILPEGEIKRTLSLPAVFHRVPEHVCVSPSAQMCYKPHAEAEFAAACRWLLGAAAPFLHPKSTELSFPFVLRTRAMQLATLWNVPLFCDFFGLPALSCHDIDVGFAIGVMLVTFSAARRLSCKEVRLYVAMEDAPTLYLIYSCADAVDALPEFHPLLAVAAARGATLDVVSPKEDPLCVQVRAHLGVVELSAQGLRERHRFLEGKRPLLSASDIRVIPPSFPEFSFDYPQNGT